MIPARGLVDQRAIMRLEGLDQLKNPIIASGIESVARSTVSQPTTLQRVPNSVPVET
jgi:hypothetical protein